MYTDHYGTEEYPFVATFYHLVEDKDKPLDQQGEEKIVSFQTKCDVDDNNDLITLYFPFDPKNEKIKVVLGEIMEVETYGLVQKGRVLGVRPSQLGGVKVMCKKI